MRFCWGACFLAVVAAIPAQERRAHPGRVVDAAGQAVAGADVWLLFAPVLASQFGTGDTVRVMTDKDGRFVAKLLGGARYMAFAGNDQAVSGWAVDVIPGRMTEVSLQKKLESTHLTFRGLEAWGERAPVRVRFGAWGADWFEAQPIVDGRVVLPPIYVRNLRAQLLDAAGDTLMIADWFRGPEDEYSVPAPQDVHVVVVDSAGKPVPGAVVKRHHEWNASGMKSWSPALELGSWLPCGTTGADGKLHLRMASRRDVFGKKWTRLLLAAREGERVGFGGLEGPRWFDGPAVSSRQRRARTMRIVVNDGIRLTGKITPPTSQSRHVLARLHARVGKPFGRGDGRWKYLRAAMDVTAGGAFESEVWPEGTIIISWMMSPPPVDLAGDDPFSQLAGKEPMIVPNDSYELHLDAKDVHTLRVHVRGVSGDPGPDVRWWALPLSSDAAYFKLALSGGCGDPGGRLALPLTKGKWMIALMNDDGYALHHVSVGDAELDTVQMQLTAFDRMVLQLEGADGKPVPRVGAHGPNLRIDPFADPAQQLTASWQLHVTRRLLNSARGNANGLLVLRYAHIQDRELSTSLYGGGNLRTERFALKPTTEPLKLRMK